MAQPITARFGKMLIELGDGETPEVFKQPCGMSSKNIQFSANLSDVNLPDCDDPDAMSWLGRDKQSLSAAVNGEGVLPPEAIQEYWTFFKSSDSRNVKISIEYSTGKMVWTGAMHCDGFNPSAEQGGRVSSPLSLQSDGELVGTWTDA